MAHAFRGFWKRSVTLNLNKMKYGNLEAVREYFGNDPSKMWWMIVVLYSSLRHWILWLSKVIYLKWPCDAKFSDFQTVHDIRQLLHGPIALLLYHNTVLIFLQSHTRHNTKCLTSQTKSCITISFPSQGLGQMTAMDNEMQSPENILNAYCNFERHILSIDVA